MPRRVAALAGLLLAARATAQQLDWIGETFDGSAVSLWTLSAKGAPVGAARGSVALPAGSSIGTDLFRCQPYGAFCQFIATSPSGATLYNVSVVDASVAGSVALPPAESIVSLHVDHTSGTSFFTALTGAGGAAVMAVSDDGAARVAVDLTRFLPAGSTIRAGGATHCSNKQLMWVAVTNATAGAILTLDLASGSVVTQAPLTFSGFDAMWADCADVGAADLPAGTLFTDGASPTLAYGEVAADGSFAAVVTGKVPAGFAPNGLLTFASLTSGDAYVAPLYPKGTTPGSGSTSGYLAFFSNPGPGLDVLPVDFYLAGASLA